MKVPITLSVTLTILACAPLNEEGRRVQIASETFVTNNNCQFLSDISNKSDYFASGWEYEMRNRAANMGGNTLVIKQVISYVVSKTGSGEVYYCRFMANAN